MPRNKIITWYKQNKRDLPWRNTKDPYKIWLSEIILQQTRVAQGLPYYLKFTEAFPTVFDLAKAPQQKVLKLWQGLGYYSRARNLHEAAKD
ncbi:MAG TPA: A/G-specific adenine glycosylase, partial [Bacteroidia bacterium]|nr:A/G-specific adenine glycosylase [Bacteroidia bacterium]